MAPSKVDSFILQAVLASRNRDRQLDGELPDQPAPSNCKPAAAKKRRPALDSNWKVLQKALAPANPGIKKRPRDDRKRPAGGGGSGSSSSYRASAASAQRTGGDGAANGAAGSSGSGSGGDDDDQAAAAAKSGSGLGAPQASLFMKRVPVRTDKVTKVIALDCEMVGVGPKGENSVLARVSVVNFHGDILYDAFVRPNEPVTDYRTQWSGVRAEDIGPDAAGAVSEFEAQRAVGALMHDRIVVGHAIKNDTKVLRIAHPWADIRDTSDFYKRRLFGRQQWRGSRGRRPALRTLVAQVLAVEGFQSSEHDSCEDARAALWLYKKNEKQWEAEIRRQVAKAKARKT